MAIEIRPITADEYRAYMVAEGVAFGGRPTDAELEQRRPTFEMAHTLAAFEDGHIIATAGGYSFELTLPRNATVALPGVSWVSVLPTHRRRGILTQMMARQLDDYAKAGYPFTMLTASESAIYGRFGYGMASSVVSYEIDRSYGRLAQKVEVPGRVRVLEHEAGIEALRTVYEQVRRLQPGMLSRSQVYWEWLLNSPNTGAEGFGARLYLAYESPAGAVEGAAYYRVKSEWINGIPSGTLQVRELYGATNEARAALWGYCLNADLVSTVRAISRPVDDPIRWMLADPRRLRTIAYNDDLWLRILDIPAALAARSYSVKDRIVLEVEDGFRQEASGCYVLDATGESVMCQRSDEQAEIQLTVADLAATYLGGVGFATLALAGRVRELTPGALGRADALFLTGRAPYAGTPF